MAGKHLSLLVHFIWSTAGREPWIGTDWQDDLYGYIGGIINNKNGKLICAGGMYDHIHLYASLPSTITIADFVSVVKSNRGGFMNPFLSDGRLLGKRVTAGSASASRRNRTSSGIFAIRNITMPNGTSRMSFWSSLIDTRLNMTKDIYGIDLCRPFGPLTK